MNLHKRPLFLLTVAYILGIICAARWHIHPLIGLILAGVILLLGCASTPKFANRSMLGLLAVIFAVGFIRTSVHRQAPPGDISSYAEEKNVYLTGRVVSDTEPLGDRVRLILNATKVKTYTGEYSASGRVVVTLYQPRNADEFGRVPFHGETIRVHGRLKKPLPATNPGGMNYGEYLARERVFCTLTGGLDEFTILKPARYSARWLAAKLKSSLIGKAMEFYPPVYAWLLIGILLGNYACLPPDVQAAFMRSGTMHLLAASGYNCGVIVCIFGFLMRRATAPRAVTHSLLIVLLWIFTLIAGPSPSIVRAEVMVTAFLLAYLLWRAPDLINIMLLACLIILALDPLSLYDVGFQLSFAAVAAIVLILPLVQPKIGEWFAPKWERGQKSPGRLTRWMLAISRDIVLAVMLSLVAVLGTWPITAYYFNYFSRASVMANAFTALLVVLLTAAGIATLALGYIWPALGHLTTKLGIGIAGSMLGVVMELGSRPWSSISVRSPSHLFILVYYLALLGALEYVHRKISRVKGMSGDNRPGGHHGMHMVSRTTTD